jgi:hypothetical protein
MTKIPAAFRSILLLAGVLVIVTRISATDPGINCPASLPEDLSPCTFDSSSDPGLTCDYSSTDCCPDVGCAPVNCQCLLSVFACVINPLPCPVLCPATKPTNATMCDLGVGIDCLYGKPFFCIGEDQFFYPSQSLCYCFNGTFSCRDFACLSQPPSGAPSDEQVNSCPLSDPWRNVSMPCNLVNDTECTYDKFCCPGGDCVPDTVCTCNDNLFVCSHPQVPCQAKCPSSEPGSDVFCNLTPRLTCEYDFGMCPDGDLAQPARVCVCDYLRQSYSCADNCNSTQTQPSASPSPSHIPSVPSLQVSSAPNVPTDARDPDNSIDCPTELDVSVPCSIDANITCKYQPISCPDSEDVKYRASCKCDNQQFICTVVDISCNVRPSTAPSKSVSPPSNASTSPDVTGSTTSPAGLSAAPTSTAFYQDLSLATFLYLIQLIL